MPIDETIRLSCCALMIIVLVRPNYKSALCLAIVKFSILIAFNLMTHN